MAVIPLTSPYSLKAATLTIAADDYTTAVTGVELTPSSSASTVRTIGGHVYRDQSTAEWAARIGIVQDLDEDGLLRYLLDHEGETRTVVLTPVAAGPTITVTVIISPASIGGTADQGGPVTSDVTLPVVGKPTFTDPE